MERYTTVGLIGKLSDVLDDETEVHPNLRQFTREDIFRAGNAGGARWLRMGLNLFSCFEQKGEFGFENTINTYSQRKAPAGAEIEAAVKAGDERALELAIAKSLVLSFLTLYDTGNLERIQLVELPEEAEAELKRMRIFAAPAVAPIDAVAIARQIAPSAEPVLTPVDQCAKDFKEMGSQAFKVKYFDNANNRPIYDQACAEGKI